MKRLDQPVRGRYRANGSASDPDGDGCSVNLSNDTRYGVNVPPI
jgi:hypothetical protein